MAVVFWAGRAMASVSATLSTLVVPFFLTITLSLDPISASLVMAGPFVMTLCSPLYAGVIADSLDRRRAMVWSDALCAALLLLLGFVSFNLAEPPLLLLVILNSALAAAGAISSACFRAGFPDIVGERNLHQANSRFQSISTVANSAGGLAGAGIVVVLGAPVAFALNAAILLCSIFGIARVPWSGSSPVSTREDPRDRGSYWQRVSGGFRLVWQNTTLLHLVLASAVSGFFISAGGFVLLWLLVRQNDFPYFAYAVVLTTGSLGAVLGAFLSERVGKRFSAPWVVQGVALVAYGLFLGSYGFITGNSILAITICCIIDFLIGFVLSLYVVVNSVQQQRIVVSAERGKVAAVKSFTNGLALAAGTSVAGLGVAWLDAHFMMFFCGIGVVATGAVFLWRMRIHKRVLVPGSRSDA